jgi:hypothetical protein
MELIKQLTVEQRTFLEVRRGIPPFNRYPIVIASALTTGNYSSLVAIILNMLCKEYVKIQNSVH